MEGRMKEEGMMGGLRVLGIEGLYALGTKGERYTRFQISDLRNF
jgi:hypothetical protein